MLVCMIKSYYLCTRKQNRTNSMDMKQEMINNAVANFMNGFEVYVTENEDGNIEFEYYDDDKFEDGLTVSFVDGDAHIQYYAGNEWIDNEDVELTKWCWDAIREEENRRGKEIRRYKQFGMEG